MRSFALVCAGLATALVGCDAEPDAAPQTAPVAESSESAESGASVATQSPVGPMTYVSLKVPNMV